MNSRVERFPSWCMLLGYLRASLDLRLRANFYFRLLLYSSIKLGPDLILQWDNVEISLPVSLLGCHFSKDVPLHIATLRSPFLGDLKQTAIRRMALSTGRSRFIRRPSFFEMAPSCPSF